MSALSSSWRDRLPGIVAPVGRGALVIAVIAFQFWTTRSNGRDWKWGQPQHDYYNLLVDGFLAGQLSMKVDVPPALLNAADPYDPAKRPAGVALHDASLYHGKYYLYFGVVPAVVLMLPFTVITGVDLPLAMAALIFIAAGFLVSVVLWTRLRRVHFPGAGAWTDAAGVVALGVASMAPVVMRRVDMWELPIASGYFFAMLTLLCIHESLQSVRRSAAWLAGAGLSLGLAIGSRPTYFFAAAALAVPLGWWWWRSRRESQERWWPAAAWWARAVAAFLPLAAIGAGLAAYNHARFGNIFEFGVSYELSGVYESKVTHFSSSYVPLNLYRYFWAPAQWRGIFPFIAPEPVSAAPAGYFVGDDLFGLWRNVPLTWLALVAVCLAWRCGRSGDEKLAVWAAAAVVLFCGVAGFIVFFYSAMARYLLDFAPVLVLLGCLGLTAGEESIAGWTRRWARVTGRVACAGVLIYSVGFAVLFSLRLNGFFAERNPAAYREVARVFNHAPALIERIVGARPGAREFEVWLPRADEARTETLLSVGDPPAVDRVFVRAVDGTHVVLGFARDSMPEVVSAPVEVSFLQTHLVRVTLGALLPPDTHPWFAGARPDEARLTSRLVRLELDGKIVLQTFRRFEATAGARERIGAKSLGDAAHPRFTSQLIAARRVPLEISDLRAALAPVVQLAPAGDFALRLKFSPEPTGTCEPLVVTGRTGQGDMFGVEYLGESRVRFVFDHWGSPLLRSEPVRIDGAATHDVGVHLPWLIASADTRAEQHGELQVELDGTPAWQQATMGYIADPEEIAFGENPIGGSNVGAKFSGEVLAVKRGRE